ATHVSVGRWDAALRFLGVDWPGGIRDAEWHLSSGAFGSLMVFEAVLQFANASFDLFPRWVCNHGSYEINRLGGPASHGCIRLHPANAATLFELVKSEGMAATTIVVSGSNPVVACNPAPSPRRFGGWERPSYD